MTPLPIEVNCGGFVATVSLDRATGDSVPVLRITQDGSYLLFDATHLDPLLVAIRAAQEGSRADIFPEAA